MSRALARVMVAALPVALLLAACTAPVAHDAGASPQAPALAPASGPAAAAAPSSSSTAAPSDAPASPALVSVLGDSHSGFPWSWYRLSVADSLVPGAAPGVFSSHPGKTSAQLRAWVGEATAQGGVVLVQAGTNDLLLDGSPPAEAASGVELLVRDVQARHVRAVLVSVPPSRTQGTATNRLNVLLRDWAGSHGVAWLDVTSGVAQPDGTWQPGLSDDGVHANESGGALMALAVRDRLPFLLQHP